MTKVKTLADLKKMKDQLKDSLDAREKGETAEQLVQVKVAMATCGIASGAKDVMSFLIEAFKKRCINGVVTQTGCMGYCYAEPTIEVKLPGKEPVVFGEVDTKKADEIIEVYVKTGELVDGVIPVNYKKIDE